jgi:ABC-type xylose transport system permease subunit
MPAIIVTIAGYLTVAGTVATTVSQSVVADVDENGNAEVAAGNE